MTEDQSSGRDSPKIEPEAEGLGGCVTRVAWLMVAPIALMFLGASMAKNGTGAWGLESALYWLVVAAAITIRYFDVVRLGGETVAGKQASRKDWQRYAMGLPAVALAVWLLAIWFA